VRTTHFWNILYQERSKPKYTQRKQGTKLQRMINKTHPRKFRIKQDEPHRKHSRKVGSPCSTRGACRVTCLTNPVINHGREKKDQHLSSPHGFNGVHVTRSLAICVAFCRSLFVLSLLAIAVLVLLRFTDDEYPFGIFKLFLHIVT
jgi:hypothetical protein